MIRPALIVLAKRPAPGAVKTRLTPPCSPEQAAALARAAIEDTLDAARSAPGVDRVVVALDGIRPKWMDPRLEVIDQGEGGLDRRLAASFAQVRQPAVLVGMDTPQVTPGQLGAAIATLADPDVDSVLGPATDGGFWCIGLTATVPDVFIGVPMSTSTTGAEQRRRLVARGDRVAELPSMRDVDDIADAYAIARQAPETRFARLLSRLPLKTPTVAGSGGARP